jgi:threonine dehydrogenase-like Zn-dependent dehydrogenase
MGKFEDYRRGKKVPEKHLAWPLFGSGIDKLGRKNRPVERKVPDYGDDELLIRHDAVGLCFTDVKEITFGEKHPRLTGRDLSNDPIVPGHEASITVVGVGKNLRNKYTVGTRFVIQPDVWYKGKSVPYSFGMDGAYRQYGVMGKEILDGDAGCYLIPVSSHMSYAAAALTEPWACVEAAYRVEYRHELKDKGNVWLFGNKRTRLGYSFKKIWDFEHRPSMVYVSDIPVDLAGQVEKLCREFGAELVKKESSEIIKSDLRFDDIFVLDGNKEEIDAASPLLANEGILAIFAVEPLSGPIKMDFGRVHYDKIVYVGTTGLDLDSAYRRTCIRSKHKPKGKMLILGAGGPMGRMHLQRAIESSNNPEQIVATDIDDNRIEGLELSFDYLAKKNRIKLHNINTLKDAEGYRSILSGVLDNGGFDDIEVMITNIESVIETSRHLANGGVMSLFAGLKRGSIGEVDAWVIFGPKQARIIGHSGSGLSDQKAIVERFEQGELEPRRSMAAVCGMNQVAEGIKAMIDAVFPGKIVVYPAVPDFPLTGLSELKKILPEVYEKLEGGRVWTREAEETFLEIMLPE